MSIDTKGKEVKLIITDAFLDSISHLSAEEQQGIIDEITEMANSGTIFEEFESVDFDELPEDMQAEVMALMDDIDNEISVDKKRTLN